MVSAKSWNLWHDHRLKYRKDGTDSGRLIAFANNPPHSKTHTKKITCLFQVKVQKLQETMTMSLQIKYGIMKKEKHDRN